MPSKHPASEASQRFGARPRCARSTDKHTELTLAFPTPRVFAQEKRAASPNHCSVPTQLRPSPGSRAAGGIPGAVCARSHLLNQEHPNTNEQSAVAYLEGTMSDTKACLLLPLSRNPRSNNVMARLQLNSPSSMVRIILEKAESYDSKNTSSIPCVQTAWLRLVCGER